jgi:hypothetical protein
MLQLIATEDDMQHAWKKKKKIAGGKMVRLRIAVQSLMLDNEFSQRGDTSC